MREHGPVITNAPVPPADPTAVFGRRTLAYLIDAAIAVALFIVTFAFVASSEDLGSTIAAESTCDALNELDSGYFCIPFDTSVLLADGDDFTTLLLVTGIYVVATQLLLPTLTGFSPGKAIVGLRVVNQQTFEIAGFGAHLVRWLLWVVDSFPWLFPLVGLISGLSSNGHRRVGDMAAKTIVIDKVWVGRPLPVPGVNSVTPATAPFAVSASPFGASPPPPPGPAVPAPPPGQPPLMPPPPAGDPAPPPPPGPTPPPPVPQTPDPDATTPLIAPPAMPAPEMPEAAPEQAPPDEPAPPPAPTPPAAPPVAPAAPAQPQPGVDAPQWDAARDTYIQWDPELAEWMEWNEADGAWVPISR